MSLLKVPAGSVASSQSIRPPLSEDSGDPRVPEQRAVLIEERHSIDFDDLVKADLAKT
jgi:hypothetical protein